MKKINQLIYITISVIFAYTHSFAQATRSVYDLGPFSNITFSGSVSMPTVYPKVTQPAPFVPANLTFVSDPPNIISLQPIINNGNNEGYNVNILGAGVVTFTASAVNDPNYTDASASATLIIEKGIHTVRPFTLPDFPYDAPLYRLEQTTTANLPVSFSVISGPALVTSNGELSITGVGAVTLRAQSAGDANYRATVPLDITFNVLKANQSIFNLSVSGTRNRSFQIDTTQALPTLDLLGESNRGLPVTFSLRTSPSTGVAEIVSGNKLKVLGPGNLTLTGTNPGNDFYEPATANFTFQFRYLTSSAITDQVNANLLYPNPVSDDLYTDASDVTDVYIYTLAGVLAAKLQVSQGKIKIAHLPSGTYRAKIKKGSKWIQQTLVKQ